MRARKQLRRCAQRRPKPERTKDVDLAAAEAAGKIPLFKI